MSKTRVVHCKKESYDVYIGRPSKWGNPYSHKKGTSAKYKVETREEAIQKYKEHLLNSPELLKDLCELKGKTLGCWCKPLACHGDWLVFFADNIDRIEKLNENFVNFINNVVELPPDCAKILDENFWDLIGNDDK